MARVLVVEDNENLADGLRSNLEFEGHAVEVARDGTRGLIRARTRGHDLIVLDLMLPGMDGFRVLEGLRAEGVATPVLVLTARGDEADKVRGLRGGADDYVTKPFALRELLARVEALLRRSRAGSEPHASPADGFRFGDVAVDPTTREVTRGGRRVPLRPKEYELLGALLRRRGGVIGRHELLREVWGYHESVLSRTLDTHVGELRRKLEADPGAPQYILTVRKTGYRLALEHGTGEPQTNADERG